MLDIPLHVGILFIFTTLLTLGITFWLFQSNRAKSIKALSIHVLMITMMWLGLQAWLSVSGVYSQNTEALPPRLFLFGIIPMIALVSWFLLSSKGKGIIDRLDPAKIYLLHVVRIPVEIVLWMLFTNSMIPELMTFEGWNFDIVMGISAPLILFLGFKRKSIGQQLVLFWNFLGIAMLAFIFIIAVLSAPFPLQQLAFDQPNVALLHYPFTWLPTFVVPVVMTAHFVSIRHLKNNQAG